MLKPSEQQQAVLDWALNNGKGSLNLVARAGCGKTSTLLMLVDEILNDDPGKSIFLGAFNRSIANELSFRLGKMGWDWRQVKAATLHSAGLSAWRKVAPDVKIDDKGEKIKNILTEFSEDSEDDARLIESAGGVIKKLVSLAKQSAFGLNGTRIEDREVWWGLVEHFDLDSELPEGVNVDDVINISIDTLNQSLKQDKRIIDFDDMLYSPLYHKARFWQYDWVMIDEAQDTNSARRLLAIALLKDGGRLVAVGDDKQAIYGFSGADSNAMRLIKSHLDSRELPLTVTYRCPKKMVEHARNLCPDLRAAESNQDGVIRTIPLLAEDGKDDFWSEKLSPADAILCRLNAPIISLAFNLIRHGIGCRVEGRDIGEGLIALANRWKRTETIDLLLRKLEEFRQNEVAKWTAKGKEAKAAQVGDKVDTLVALCEGLLAQGRQSRGDVVRAIRDLFGDTKPGERPNVITLSTVHKAKGREWKRVYILGRNKYMPLAHAKQAWELEQENNLIYVAVTRAMHELVFVDI